MNRVMKLIERLPEVLERDQRGEPPLFPPADPLQYHHLDDVGPRDAQRPGHLAQRAGTVGQPDP